MFSVALILALSALGISARVLEPPKNSSSTWLNNPMTTLTPIATVDGSSIAGTILTETIAGAPSSATYIPTTLSDYTTLSTSTTITSTTTGSDGNPTPIPIVLGPGGIGWVPFIPPGGAPVPPGFTPPPIVPVPGQPGSDPTATQSSASSSSSTCPGVDPIIPDETLPAPLPPSETPTTTAAPSTTAPPPPPPTTTEAPPPPTTTAPPPPPPVDPFRCDYGGLFVLWAYELYGISGWGGDNGDDLHHQVSGCGLITDWHWTQAQDGTFSADFHLPLTMKGGCVERAIASAGGPTGVSCSDVLG